MCVIVRAHRYSLFSPLIYPNDIMGVNRFLMWWVVDLDIDDANDRHECIAECKLKFPRVFARAADHNEAIQSHVSPRWRDQSVAGLKVLLVSSLQNIVDINVARFLEKEVPRRMQGRPTSLDGASSYVCCGIRDRIEYQWAVTIHVVQQHW